MSKIEDLNKMINDLIADEQDLGKINKLTALNNVVEECVNEDSESRKQYTELLDQYKKVVKHTSYSEAPANDIDTPKQLSVEEALDEFLKNRKKQ